VSRHPERVRPRGLRLGTVNQALDYRDQVFINFRDFAFEDSSSHGYRWVDLKRFGLPSADQGHVQLLDALISHDQFRDDYAGGGVDPVGTRHGSYWLDHITAEAYEPVNESTATGILSTWARQYGDLPQLLADTLEREIYALVRAATSRYRLKDLGKAAFHNWGGVHGEFHELVLVDRVAATLALIVAADD
jgi:hypothetical protein